MELKISFNITRTVFEATERSEAMKKAVHEAVNRFCASDWGNIPVEDKESNIEDLKNKDGHVLARYNTPEGDIYINLEFLPPEENIALIMFCNEY